MTILASAEPVGSTAKSTTKYPDKRRVLARFRQLEEQRQQYEQRWKHLRDTQLPWVGTFDSTSDGTNPARRRDLKTMTSVCWQSAQTFAAGVMSGLTPPSRNWFKFGFNSGAYANNVRAMRVLDERQEILTAYLSKSNFYTSVFQVYMELPLGQGALGVFESSDGIRFQQYPIGTYYIGANATGEIDTFARKYKLTAHQLADQFGTDVLPLSIQRVLDTTARYSQEYTVYWLVEPNDGKDCVRKGNVNLPYRSIYWLEHADASRNGGYLYIGGFREFPVPIARYQVRGKEAYATGAAWYAEADTNQLNVLIEDYLRAVELSVKPPIKSPASVYERGISLKPGGVTIADEQMGSSNSVQPLFQVSTNLDYLQAEIQRKEDSIKRTYNADLFLLLDGIDKGQMTAREVMERQQEKLQQLGPVVERLQFEFLSKIIERVYNILDRAGIFPPVPEDIAENMVDTEVKIEYISPLAQAQKMSGLVNIEQAASFAAQMAQLDPNVLHTIDAIGAINKYMDMLGAPADMRRSKDETEERIQAQQQAMQEARQQEQAMRMAQASAPVAQAAKNLTEAANDGNPALTEWLGMGGV
nr:MAG TPA: head to tail connecting protein [Caudoviricetes sp.]